jgi:rubrerythrin
MEYEGKGNRNDYSSQYPKKKLYNKTFYLVCEPCNYHADKNVSVCPKCDKFMHKKSQMGRTDKDGNIFFP